MTSAGDSRVVTMFIGRSGDAFQSRGNPERHRHTKPGDRSRALKRRIRRLRPPHMDVRKVGRRSRQPRDVWGVRQSQLKELFQWKS
jgi:hypothetical protein